MVKIKEKTSDEARGYRDRKAGYYDKWFRYNRADEGSVTTAIF